LKEGQSFFFFSTDNQQSAIGNVVIESTIFSNLPNLPNLPYLPNSFQLSIAYC